MNVVLWIVQIILAIFFLIAGYSHAFQSLDALAKRLPWVADVPAPLLRFIGISELLGAIGLILPGLTGILPWLTVAAAIGLMIVMASAAVFHISRREYASVGVNAVPFVLAAFVAYGRWVLAPF